MKRWPVVASFIFFILLCASAAYWVMQLLKPPLRAVAAPPQTVQSIPRPDAAAGLFGGRSTVAVASNFQLKGVVVSGRAADSVAILATDGKPARAIRINAEVAPNVVVKEVHKQYVLLSDGGVVKRVEMPESTMAQLKMEMSPSAPVRTQTAPPVPPTVVVNPAPAPPPAAPTAPPNNPAGVVANPLTQPAPAVPAPSAAIPQPPVPAPPAAIPQPPVSSQPTVPAQPAVSAQPSVSPQSPVVVPSQPPVSSPPAVFPPRPASDEPLAFPRQRQ
jgi:general secretion pathway protein C